MESKHLAQPGESKLINAYGDAQTLDAQAINNFGITVSSPRPDHIQKKNVDKPKEEKKSDVSNNAIFMRLKKTKDTDYCLSVNRKSFKLYFALSFYYRAIIL
jgi:hypothetical protein